MKGKFDKNEYLKQNNCYQNLEKIEKTIQERQPYAVIAISTTGLDDYKGFKDHEPIRVTVQEYEFDTKIQQYKEGFIYDRLIQCNQNALNEALNNEKYDVFSNGDINKDAYIAGENVMSKENFEQDFSRYMANLSSKCKLMIAVQSSFVRRYLSKINCTTALDAYEEKNEILNQPYITSEYFAKNDIDESKNGLEQLSKHLPNAINEYADNYQGNLRKVKLISGFITKYGKENNLLESDFNEYYRRNVQEQHDAFYEQGKEKYKKSNLESKLDVFVKKGQIVPDEVMNRNSNTEINKLFKVLRRVNDNKGLVIMQAATTGFDAGNDPMQFTAVAIDIVKGKLKPTKTLSVTIQADELNIEKAVQIKANLGSRGFDIFKDNGISVEDYTQGNNVKTKDEAFKLISDFFKQYPEKDYPIITNGTLINKSTSITHDALSKIGNLSVSNSPYIDGTKAIIEYVYLAQNCPEYKHENVVIRDPENYQGSLSLADLAKDSKIDDIAGSMKKCIYTSVLIGNIANQQLELFRDTMKHLNDPEIEILPKGVKIKNTQTYEQHEQNSTAQNNTPNVPLKRIPDNNNNKVTDIRNNLSSKFKHTETKVSEKENTNVKRNIFRNVLPKENVANEEELQYANPDEPYQNIVEVLPDSPQKFNEKEFALDESLSDDEIIAILNDSNDVTTEQEYNNNQLLNIILQTVGEQNKIIAVQQETFQSTFKNIIEHQSKMIEKMMEKQVEMEKNMYLRYDNDLTSSVDDSISKYLDYLKTELNIVNESINNVQVKAALDEANANIAKGKALLEKTAKSNTKGIDE